MSLPFHWTLAQRTSRMNSSVLRELLKLSDRPGVLSLAGGLPAAEAFPVEALRTASEKVLRDHPREALQYGHSEGLGLLRDWVAAHLSSQGQQVTPQQVLITNGSQQGLDLVGKVLIDSGSRVRVESPTYLGALQAFMPFDPVFEALAGDAEGTRPEALSGGGRFAYLVPNYQNPTGRCLSLARRQALVLAAERAGLPLLEDNPYGELWYDEPPPTSLAALWPEGVIYLGSFSKVLAPGLRLGYVVAPRELVPRLLQAKQAADLHTAVFNQRLVYEVLLQGMLPAHLQGVRARYKVQRDAMAAALRRHLPSECAWQVPSGGMFFWVQLPPALHLDGFALLEQAVERGVAFVPGAAFFAPGDAAPPCMRLSFVTLSPAQIEQAVMILGQLLHDALHCETVNP